MKLSNKHIWFPQWNYLMISKDSHESLLLCLLYTDSHELQELTLLYISLMDHSGEDRGDGIRLKSFVNKISLLLDMKLVKTSGCSSWRKTPNVFDVVEASSVQCFHGRAQPWCYILICSHVHRLFLTPHYLCICLKKPHKNQTQSPFPFLLCFKWLTWISL